MESRRRTISVASGYWRNPFIGTGADEDKQGSESKHGKSTQRLAKPTFDFLNTRFEVYPIVKFSDTYSEENYYYLYHSAKNYLKLLGKDLGLNPKEYDFCKLYRTFNSLLPECQECELVRENDTIYFHIFDNRMGWEILYIPCRVIDRVDTELSEIFVDFFNLFHNTQGLTSLKEDPMYQFFVSESEHYGLKNKEERKRLSDEYEKGQTGKILDRIAEKPAVSITKLRNRIKKYNPHLQEVGILALMLEGLELFKAKKQIIKYGFFPFETEDYYNCYYPVELHQFLMIVYEEDMLYAFMSEWLTGDADEQSAEVFSGGNLVITPGTRTPLKVSPYVINFFNWLKRFENELYDL